MEWLWSLCRCKAKKTTDIVQRKGSQSHYNLFLKKQLLERKIFTHICIIDNLFTIHLICKLCYVAIWNLKCNIMLLLLILHLFIILFQIFAKSANQNIKTAFVFVLYCCYEIWWGFQTKGKKLLIISVVNYKTCYILIQFVIIHWSVVFIQIQSISKSQWKQSILPLFCSSHSTLWFSLFQE